MADVASTLQSWSITESSNSPSGSTVIGSGLDDNIRMLQAVVRSGLAHYNSTPIASASTVDLNAATGNFLDISGTTTITALGTASAGIWKVLRFTGALTLTHNGTSLILPGSANITTANGDIAWMYSLGSGNWVCAHYQPVSGKPLVLDLNALTAETTIATGDYLAIYDVSGSDSNKMLVSDFLKVVNALTQDTAPDRTSDFVMTYDASATAAKKVSPGDLWYFGLASSSVVQTAFGETTTNFGTSSSIASSTTAPTSSSGVAALSLSITPQSSSNKVRVRFMGQFFVASTPGDAWVAAFRGTTLIAAQIFYGSTADNVYPNVHLEVTDSPATTSSTTYSIRFGPVSGTGTTYINGNAGTSLLGGNSRASVVLEEIKG